MNKHSIMKTFTVMVGVLFTSLVLLSACDSSTQDSSSTMRPTSGGVTDTLGGIVEDTQRDDASNTLQVRVLVEPSLEFDGYSAFSEGLARVSKDGANGFVDKTGNVVIPLIYDRADDFSEGLAAVRNDDDTWGYIDMSGAVVIPFIYEGSFGAEAAKAFGDGLAPVKKDGKWGYIDKSGNEVIPFIYDNANSFSEGLAAVLISGEGWGVIDTNGNEVAPFKYSDIRAFSDGMAAVVDKSGNSWLAGYIDSNGNEVIPIQYNSDQPFRDGIAYVERGLTRGFIDKTGNEAVVSFTDDVNIGYKSFSEGLAPYINSTFRWGYIDLNGETVIRNTFNDAQQFREGLARVQSGQNYGYIDRKGDVVVEIEYGFASQYFNGGLAWVSKDGKLGILEIVNEP